MCLAVGKTDKTRQLTSSSPSGRWDLGVRRLPPEVWGVVNPIADLCIPER